MYSCKFKKKFASIIISSIVGSSMFLPTKVQALGPFDIKSSFISKGVNEQRLILAPGIMKKVYTFIDNDGKIQQMFVVEADSKNANVCIRSGSPNDKSKYGMQAVSMQAKSAIATNNNVVAAINGDFYYMVTGEPIGVIYRNGKAVKSKFEKGWNFFGILKDGTPIIGDEKKYNEIKDELLEALGGNAMLVNNGSVYETPPIGAYREPRTAIGIRNDGTTFFVAIDGKQQPYSAGVSIKDLAQLMKDMGAVQALNLDGGGSSTFVSKKVSNDKLSLDNRPSDGHERNVGNSWLITTRAKPNKIFSFANIEPFDKSFTPKSVVKFKAIGKDEAGHKAQLPYEGVVWEISDKSFGTIDSKGNFSSSGKLGQTEILIYYDGKIIGRNWIEITNPDEIHSTSKQIRIDKGGQSIIKIYGTYKGRGLNLKDENIIWQTSGDIGTVDSKGKFFASNKSAKGKIIAKIKGTKVTTSIDVIVGNPAELNKIVIPNKTRIAGKNRFQTSLAVAEKMYDGEVSNVVIASGYNYADQISAGILGNYLKAPVLLIGNNSEYDEEVLAYIKQHLNENGKINIIGGNDSVKNNFIYNMNALGINNIERINGKDIYETHIKINDMIDTNIGTPIIIASGEGFADALSITSIAQIKNYPVVLTGKDKLSNLAQEYISRIKPSKVYIVGGQGVISEGIKSKIKQLTLLDNNNIIRISGKNRYNTNINILKSFNLSGDTICIASGATFADSLIGSTYATYINAPILLVDNNINLCEQKQYVDFKNYKKCIIFGGKGVVSENLIL